MDFLLYLLSIKYEFVLHFQRASDYCGYKSAVLVMKALLLGVKKEIFLENNIKYIHSIKFGGN